MAFIDILNDIALKQYLPFSSVTTRRDFRTRRDFFASMGTAAFEHGNGLNSRLVVADQDHN